MTMGDVLVLVAGVAAAYVVVGTPLVNPFDRTHNGRLVFEVIRFLQGTSLAVTSVALARVGLYRRMPSAAEWLGILVGCTLLGEWSWLDVDEWIYAYQRTLAVWLSPSDFTGARWFVAGVFSAKIAIGLGLLRLGRRLFPTWIKTILLSSLALLAMSVPLRVLSLHGADSISPSGGLGPGILPFLYQGICMLIAFIPMGLLFGLPAVAAIRQRILGRRWNWVEWAAAGTSALALLALVIATPTGLNPTSPEGLGLRFLVIVGLGVIGFISNLILNHVSEPWCLWTEGPAAPDQSSPESDSAASTR
jgi:hypothetical protein